MNDSVEDDLFYRAIHKYEKGNILEALQNVISSPDICYESISSEVSEFRYLINYFDACVFGGRLEVQITRKILFDEVEKNPYLKIVLNNFIEVLEEENVLGNAFASESINVDVGKVPLHLQPMAQKKINVIERWNRLCDKKPAVSKIFSDVDVLKKLPWHCFAYTSRMEPLVEESGEIPLVILEPFEGIDYEKILSPYIGVESIFVCATYADFFHMLQWDAVVDAFASPKSVLYILEAYPQLQFFEQIKGKSYCRPLKIVLMTSRTAIREVAPLLKSVLEKCFSESNGDFSIENSTGNWLYNISKRLLLRIQAERLGRSRSFALSIYNGIQNWHDVHKGLSPPDVSLGPLPRDYLGEIYAEESKRRTEHLPVAKEKKRIAHVVTQIVDGGHAPTMLVRNLLQYSDKEKYECFLVSTERLVHYPLEYPIPLRDSFSSIVRGANTLNFFKQMGVNLLINTKFEHYESTARYLAGMINLLGFDIVIFHGPDETNNLIGSLSEASLRVLFDHGTLPAYPCYDLVIVSSEDALKLHQENLKALGMDSRTLMFCVDVRKGWEPRAYTKEELGFPADSFIMTTISHHLEARMGDDFCHAIGEVLQRCPQAYYAPIGPIKSEEKFRAIFSKYGVNGRVVFMGNRKNPSQYARSMDLYLNEYPFGSGIGLLDAMASGCPIVSMYDEQGPQQARYGGTYFGVDHVITTGKREDYVNLACRLIEDKELYKEWSTHAVAQYEKRADEREYVKHFEALLEKRWE